MADDKFKLTIDRISKNTMTKHGISPDLSAGIDGAALARLQEIQGPWSEGATEYDLAMAHAFHEFYNERLSGAYKLKPRDYSGCEAADLFQNADRGAIMAHMTQNNGKGTLSAMDWLQSDAVTRKLGHKMTEDEAYDWAVDTCAAMKNDLVLPGAGISCDELRKRLKKNKEAELSADLAEAQKQIQESEGEDDEFYAAASPVPEDGGDAGNGGGSSGGTDGKGGADNAGNGSPSQEGQPKPAETAGDQAGTQASDDSVGSDEWKQNMAQAQLMRDNNGMSQRDYMQFMVLQTVLDISRRTQSSYMALRENAEYLTDSRRATRRGRRIAAQMTATIDEHNKLINRTMQLNNAMQRMMNDRAEEFLRQNGTYVPRDGNTGPLGRMRADAARKAAEKDQEKEARRLEKEERRAEKDAAKAPEGDGKARKPLGAKAFLAIPPVMFIRNVAGKIRGKLGEAIERNEAKKEEPATEAAVDRFADVMDVAPDEPSTAKDSRFKGFFRNLAAAVKAKLPHRKAKDGPDAPAPDTGHDDTGHDDTGHDDTGHDDTGHDDTGHDDTGHDDTGHDDTGHDDTGHDDTGHDDTGHDDTGHDDTGHDDTGHDDTGHDDTGHDDTGHDGDGSYGDDYDGGSPPPDDDVLDFGDGDDSALLDLFDEEDGEEGDGPEPEEPEPPDQDGSGGTDGSEGPEEPDGSDVIGDILRSAKAEQDALNGGQPPAHEDPGEPEEPAATDGPEAGRPDAGEPQKASDMAGVLADNARTAATKQILDIADREKRDAFQDQHADVDDILGKK